MANWLSIQAAAEKYGVTEGVIRGQSENPVGMLNLHC